MTKKILTNSAETTPQKSGRIAFLDYLRLYACLGVLECHVFKSANSITFAEESWFYNALSSTYNFLMPALMAGGVVVFFLISGYIIAYIIERESTAVFLVRRLFRIYPAYITAVLAQFYFVSHALPRWKDLLPRFSLLGDFTGTPQVLNGVDWTLRIEIVFYAFAALLACVKIARHPFLLKVGFLPFAALIIFFMPSFPPGLPGVFNQFFPFLFLGMSFYYFELGKAPTLYVISLAAFVFIGYEARHIEGWMHAPSYFVPVAVFALMWGYRRKIPDSKFILFAARATYTVYLFHNWYIVWARDSLIARGVGYGVSETLALVSLLMLCYAVHFMIEQPFINLGKFLTRRRVNPVSAIAVPQQNDI